MLGLDSGTQSEFVGIRSTFYRLSSIFGQGVLVALAGMLDTRTGDVHYAWKITLILSAVLFSAVTLYHTFTLPRPSADRMSSSKTAMDIVKDFGRTFEKASFCESCPFLLLIAVPRYTRDLRIKEDGSPSNIQNGGYQPIWHRKYSL